ncbi:GNAT domain-containing protein [Aspergillus cavernicola]|uniref:GNAT domain-containing protein n=1 Tax=Aspergillus cavernicola TaxID=176166 RepID=A0ABR4IDC2_9EURO
MATPTPTPSTDGTTTTISKTEEGFTTPRLSFTPPCLSDAQALNRELRTQNEVMRWSRQKRPDKDLSETEDWIRRVLSNTTGPVSSTEKDGFSGSGFRKGCSFSIRELSYLQTQTQISEEDQNQEKNPPNDRIIGVTGISQEDSDITGKRQSELGYMFVPGVWGQGYASEAVRGLMRWWFEVQEDTEEVYAVVAKGNAASLRVMEKCGFVAISEGVDGTGEAIVEFCITRSAV